MVFSGFPGGSDSKASACNVEDLGSIPGSGRSPGEGNSNPLQYSCLENPMDRGMVGYSPWGHKESDMTEQLFFLLFFVSQGACPLVGLLGHIVVLFLFFKGRSVMSSRVAIPVYTPTNSIRDFPSLLTYSSIYCLLIFFMMAILMGMR